MTVHLDLETRSFMMLTGPNAVGQYKYFEDHSTLILCLAVKKDDGPVMLWLPESSDQFLTPKFDLPRISTEKLKALVDSESTFVAHNAGFERCGWKLMVEQFGFRDIRHPSFWKDTAAMAAALALPRALGDVATVLDLPQQKDKKGHRVMMKWCKPRKPTKNNSKLWCDDPEEFYILCDYCLQDVYTEYAVDCRIPDLSKSEQELWELDQKINDLGIKVDLDSIENLQAKVYAKNKWLIEEAADLNISVTLEKKDAKTGEVTKSIAKITSPKQTAKVIALLNERGYPTETVDADFLKEFLKREDIEPDLRRLLEIRKLINKTSVAKLKTMKTRAQADGRVRGSLLYHGASTGRWAAKGLQLQNFPRTKYKDDDVEKICNSSVFEVEKEGPVHDTASKCLRSMLIPEKGRMLIGMDFSNIEGRVAAWLAGEHWKVEAFEAYDQGTGPDLYVLSYAKSFGVPIDKVDDDMRQVGKCTELSLQFAGFSGALKAMSEKFGLTLSDEVAMDLCMKWRAAHPSICRAWYSLGDAAIQAIENPGQFVAWRNIKMVVTKDFLRIRLPSGRPISYFKPSVFEKDHYGKLKKAIRYHGVHTYTRKWSEKCTTHGGDIFQSVVQGTARDFLSESMLSLDASGFQLPFHVHDEAVAEELTDRYDEMKAIMSVVPEWGEGCPISCEGFVSTRYQK